MRRCPAPGLMGEVASGASPRLAASAEPRAPVLGTLGPQPAPCIGPGRIPEAERSLDGAGEGCPQERGCEVGAAAGKGALVPPLCGDSVCGMPMCAQASPTASTCPEPELGSPTSVRTPRRKKTGGISSSSAFGDSRRRPTAYLGSRFSSCSHRCKTFALQLTSNSLSCLNQEKTDFVPYMTVSLVLS